MANMDVSRNSFASEMRRLRRTKGKLIADQAREFGLAPSKISSIEIGEVVPPAGYISDIILWLNLTKTEAQELNRCFSSVAANTSNGHAICGPFLRNYIPQDPSEIKTLRLPQKRIVDGQSR
jgi:transcriptional regulator with XRE-family HTH domain